jgi:23S rRNA maturation-related 3'-5' exoribonuclease YhaM
MITDNETVQQEIYKFCKKVKRKGFKKLVDDLDSLGYFEAPASTQYHLNYSGGLAQHSLNVCNHILKMAKSLDTSGMGSINTESMILVALFHDLGKAKFYDKEEYIPNILKNKKVSDKKPFKTNRGRPPVGHNIASVQVISQYITLTPEEFTAIIYHDGLYTNIGRDINGKEQPLQLLLHWADMWCSHFVEVDVEAEPIVADLEDE